MTLEELLIHKTSTIDDKKSYIAQINRSLKSCRKFAIIEWEKSDEKGVAEKDITVPLDKKYLTPGFGSTEDIRGTVTLIAYREGYTFYA